MGGRDPLRSRRRGPRGRLGDEHHLELHPGRRPVFFVWLLEPEGAGTKLERELEYWRGVLSELEAINERPPGPTRKEKAFRLALEGGIRTVEARVAWLESAIDEWAVASEVEWERDPASSRCAFGGA